MKHAYICLAELAEGFMTQANHFFLSNANDVLFNVEWRLQPSQAREIVLAILTDRVNVLSRWAKISTDTALEKLQSHIPWLDAEGNDVYSDEFMHRIYDTFECLICDMIETVIPDETWEMWDIKDAGLDVVLTRGKDFRVAEWERMTGYYESKTKTPVKEIMTRVNPKIVKVPLHTVEGIRQKINQLPVNIQRQINTTQLINGWRLSTIEQNKKGLEKR